MRLVVVLLTLASMALFAGPAGAQPAAASSHDLVIYGGTAGGVAAAVQARRMGKTAVLIEPTRRLGGLTTGGLGQTDIGNKAAIGGISREFYQRIARHYSDPASWRWQKRQEYRSAGQSRTDAGEDAMWTFEPSAALKVLNALAKEAGVEVVYGQRLDRRPGGVKKDGARITSITMESGRTFAGATFIDATYEGDLMAAAGVPYHVGREGLSQYGESLNGVQAKMATHHQFVAGVDPYVRKGDPSSGLLPFIDPRGPGDEGAADKRVQAYNFRMCLTDHPDNRIPFAKPEGYDEQWFELLFRNFEAGFKLAPWHPALMPNRKTDVNNNHGFSTDFIGQNYDYPEASYAEREKIVARHRLYQQGLMWTLANHPRVPEPVRKEVSRWGLCKDEFTEGNGWQEQIYVREARRMIGQYVMTQHNCQGKAVAEKPVGMGAYNMDSHHVQRHVDANGHVKNEGDVQVGVSPYPVDYGAIIPKAEHATNLLVPVALSATHIAYGSIRMEPVFMVLGQSAATAAVMAIDGKTSVQEVDYAKLRDRLLADKQVLEWKGRRVPVALPGTVIDDEQARLQGAWTQSRSTAPFIADGYRHDGDAAKGQLTARFEAKLPSAGRYEVRLAYSAHANRATNVPVTVEHAGGAATVKVNQRKPAPIDGAWQPLGTFEFAADRPAAVTISNADTDGHVIADAVQFLPAK